MLRAPTDAVLRPSACASGLSLALSGAAGYLVPAWNGGQSCVPAGSWLRVASSGASQTFAQLF